MLIRCSGLLPQRLLHSRVAGREVKDGHVFYLCRPGQVTGLPGCEMVFARGNLPVLIQKDSLNKKVIGSFDQRHNLFPI